MPRDAVAMLDRAQAALESLMSDPAAIAQRDQEPDEALIGDLLAVVTQIPATLPGSEQHGMSDATEVQQHEAGSATAGDANTAEARRQRLLPAFLAEARQIGDALHRQVDVLRDDALSIDALLGATRSLHTLKGNSASMRIEVLVRLADAGETLLEQLALAAAPINAAQIGLLSDLDGAVRHVIDCVDHGESPDAKAIEPLLVALKDPRNAVALAPEPAVTEERAPQVQSGGAVSIGQLRVMPRSAPQPAPQRPAVEAAREPAAPPKPMFSPRSSSEPERSRQERRTLTESLTTVDLGDVNRAIDLFGRLVTSRTMIARGIQVLRQPVSESARNSVRLRGIIDRLASEFEVVRRERRAASQSEGWDPVELETFDAYTQIMLELGEIVADQEEIADSLQDGVRRTAMICEGDLESTDQLQQSLLGFRLVRLNTIEPRLEQVVSSTARSVGKQINWRLRGGSIALDKAVLDAVQEPLLHLLRNAIDHGIEAADVRLAAGKPAAGTVTIDAAYGSNSVIIRVVDDGCGIDPQRVAAAAVRRGLVTQEVARSLDTRALLNLIWQPGFSTAEAVTDISGRGVGLDIVQSALTRVRGSVSVQSHPGRGTTFSLSLPLSLTVVRTLLLRDGKAAVAVPIAQIEGVHLVSRENITHLHDRTAALIEGRTITVLPQGLARPVAFEERLSGDTSTVLEVRVGPDRTVGFLIDEVLGEEDTLVKALPSYLAHISTFVGCSVGGDGRPYAIVDPRHLAGFSAGGREARGADSPLPAYSPTNAQTGKPLAIVVDDSLFMRRSLAEVYAEAGFRVDTAEDGEAALAIIARTGMPELISLDMEMPRMNGLEMLSILRQLPGGQHVPVFMITTRGQDRHRAAAIKAGVTRYFIKPFSSEELLAAARDECRSSLASRIA